MSLLIDALKQAEAARAQTQDGEPAAERDGLALEPLPSDTPATQSTSQAQPAETRPTTQQREARRTRPLSSTAPNDATRELFEVKRQAPNRTPLILATIGVVLLLGGCIYVWWAMQPRSSMLGTALTQTSNAVTPSPVFTAQPTPPTNPEPALAPARQLPPASMPDEVTRSPIMRTPKQLPPTPTVNSVEEAAPQIRRSGTDNISEPGIPSGIQSAYTALLEGKLALATQRYQEVLRQDPRNIDAINALGMIAWRNGQPDVAERMFRMAQQVDPKDATSFSQLALFYAASDPASAESRLRTAIANQPSAAAAHYALGSLMARQGRWSEAQQSLFQAYSLDSDNPDVLFNLAVSLEHLNQLSVARQFYERAVQASARRPAGFDRSVAQSRMQALTGR